jgi:hypothetical protein
MPRSPRTNNERKTLMYGHISFGTCGHGKMYNTTGKIFSPVFVANVWSSPYRNESRHHYLFSADEVGTGMFHRMATACVHTPHRQAPTLLIRVARFVLVQHTKTGKIYQITIKYTKWPLPIYAKWPQNIPNSRKNDQTAI